MSLPCPIEISWIETLLLANPAIPFRGRRPQMRGREPLAPVIGLHGIVVFCHLSGNARILGSSRGLPLAWSLKMAFKTNDETRTPYTVIYAQLNSHRIRTGNVMRQINFDDETKQECTYLPGVSSR